MHPFLEPLVNRFPQAVLTAQQDPVRLDLWAQVTADHWLEIAQFLHDDPSMALDHITDICSADYPDNLERFEVIYHFLSLPHRTRLRIKARVTEDQAEIASISAIWKGANFLEREVYDLMGIRFSGHPDLRRILMPDDYDEGYPLRKDFPAEGKGWRSRFDFLPRLDEPVGEWSESEVPDDQRHQFMADDHPGDTKRTTELLLNMGPQHPSTHGGIRFVLTTDGEVINRAVPDIGYLHRGLEKIAEKVSYHSFMPFTDRLDYLASMNCNHGWAKAVETLAKIEVPKRAQYIRVITDELNRL